METETLITIGSIAVLIVLSGIFSGSETAFTAASQPRMHLLSKQGNHRADIVTRLHGQKDKMIGAILLGNNLVNILASALATGLMISSFGESGVVYATIIMTVLVLIFGEVMPKTYALHHADKVALTIAPSLRVIVGFLSPVTHSLNFVILRTMKLFGIQFDTGLEWGASEEALRGAIELHRGAEPTVREERIMLRSILDLADVDVGEIMQHRQDVIAVDADLPPHQIIEQIIDCPYTRIPMWRDQPENIVGVLHSKELLRQVHGNRDNLDKIDMNSISTPPWFIPESTSLLDQLSMFRRRHEHFAMVVDEYGSIMGVVTLEDILEEIVGDIVDEHDIVPVGVRPQSDGTFLIDGRVTIRDLNRRFDWSLPDDAASTLAGLVIEIARIIPEAGQIFTFKGFRFEVASRRRNRLASIKVTPPIA